MENIKTRTRSPKYPYFPLQKAIEKAELLWKKDGKLGAPRDVALRYLGHNTESGSALRTLSAVKGFGLITEGEGRIYLTDLAEKIILYKHDKKKQLEYFAEAIAKYPIYKVLLERYGETFPSTETLTAELIRTYKFNPKAVKSFLRAFFGTIRFAGLLMEEGITDEDAIDENAIVDEEPGEIEEDYGKEENVEESTTTKRVIARKEAMTFLISADNWATITFSRWPVDSDDLEALKSYIDVSIGRLKKKQSGD